MAIRLLHSTLVTDKTVKAVQARPEFRRATRNMLFALAAAEQAFTAYPVLLKEKKRQLGIIIASGHGELETTTSFLRHLGESGIARPIFFQYSLHNATLGFLTKHYELRSPAFTVSSHYFSGEESLELACTLLEEPHLDYCLVIGLDLIVPRLKEAIQNIYPNNTQLSEGAAAVLLASEIGVKALPLHQNFPALKSVIYQREATTPPPICPDFYEADGIAKLATALEADPNRGSLTSVKPDGTQATIRWETDAL